MFPIGPIGLRDRAHRTAWLTTRERRSAISFPLKKFKRFLARRSRWVRTPSNTVEYSVVYSEAHLKKIHSGRFTPESVFALNFDCQ